MARGWTLTLFAIFATLMTLVWSAPVWTSVVFLLIVAVGLIQIFRQTQTQVQASSLAPDASVFDQYWTDWLGGWYWQTDDQYRLVVLKPPAGASQVCWRWAHRLVDGDGSTQAWGVQSRAMADPMAADAWDVLDTQMCAKGLVDVPNLPWPMAASQVEGELADQPRMGRLRGVPRLDRQGQWVGHHGVWQPAASVEPLHGTAVAPVAVPDLARAPAPAPDARSEDEINQAAQEALRYALSHDLRAPLRVVDGFARILKEDYGNGLDRIGNDHVDRILAASLRMNGMIDAVLDQAQLSQAPLQLKRVDLSGLSREIATELLVAARPPAADALSGAPGTPVAVVPQVQVSDGLAHLADEVLVRRILENLIGNALKYSNKVAQPRIEIGAVPATNPTVFFVRDNGAGFDMKHADKLFGLFQRLHSAREFPGTGVGLASVNNIVRRHGGRVWAESAPGKGACFYFTLMASGPAQSGLF